MGLVRKKSNKTTENCVCEKQEYIRYAVVKFTNQTYGVVDKNHYHIIDPDSIDSSIHRDEHSRILQLGQTTIQKAKKLAKQLNKQVKDTNFEEIK